MVACSVVFASAAQQQIFVSQDGSDTAAGTREAPFATIERAMQAVRDLELPTAEPGEVTVLLSGGTHTLLQPLHFGPEDSGTEACPVVYRSYPGERAVISGGKAISGSWSRVPGKPFYQIQIPEARDGGWVFNSLYVNGVSRTRARTPNWDEKVFRAEGRAPGGDPRQSFTYCAGDIDPTWTNLTDIDLVLLCSWTPTIHRVESVDADRRVVTFHSSHSRTVDAWETHFRYYVANVYEALDSPGEWYLNRTTGLLSYYPLPGEDIAAAEVVAPVLKSRLVECVGDVAGRQFIGNLHFRGLTFAYVDGDLDRYNGVYRQGHMFLDAAIYMEGVRDSSITNCEIAHVGEYALEMTHGCRNNRVQQCHIWDAGAGAMQIGVTSLGPLLAGRQEIRPDDIVLEAETADVQMPMTVEQDDRASHGAYVVLAAGQNESGSTTFHVTPAAPGVFSLMARVIAPSGRADSFLVTVNDGPTYTYDTGTHRDWGLSEVRARELDGGRLRVDLGAGANTIVFGGREPGTKLDQLVLRRLTDTPADEGPAPNEVLSILIDNNLIHRLGTIWHGCYGIVNRFASFTQITHNDISDVHWDAIGLDARWSYTGEKYSHGNVVAYNHLHRLGLGYHTDAGGIYQFGPLDTHIHHNRIHDTVAYPYICGYAGVYLDEQSRGALVEKNLVYNVDWPAYFQHKGMDNVFRNNIGAFARDGLLHRGALNDRWKANYLEACRNIYVADNNIALRKSWAPGEKPPVLHHNMYTTIAPDTALTFAGKTFEQWQEDGQDAGSVVGDPGFVDPANLDFTLKPDAPAVSAIGFEPFDDEIRTAGLYGDEAWTRLPDSLTPRTRTPWWSQEDMIRFVQFSLDFEDMPDGCEPPQFNLRKDGEGTFEVTSEVASTGRKSYKCTDRKGLTKPFYPYIHIAPRGLDSGGIRFTFDTMNSPEEPLNYYVEFRGAGSTNQVGPSITFGRDGTIVANGVEVLRVPPGTWCRVEVTFELGENAPREYELHAVCSPSSMIRSMRSAGSVCPPPTMPTGFSTSTTWP
jgi:hypothetical protein